MILSEIIKNLKVSGIFGTTEIEISDIVYDSRKTVKNSVFVCLTGTDVDGHDFINNAISKGACAIVTEKKINIPGVTFVWTDNTREFLAGMSANFFDHPAEKLTTIGITGTKGKTTTSYMIKSILQKAGYKTGIIGTIGAVIDDTVIKLPNTTPESYEVQKHLNNMIKSGCKYAVMEASSIGLKDHRLDGFKFNFGIFMNLSHDHIGQNEHADIKEYLESKSMLFQKCAVGFVNSDDKNHNEIIKNRTCEIKTFSCEQPSNYQAENIKLTNNTGFLGVSFDIKNRLGLKSINVPIPGKFNVYNALAAVSLCDYIKINHQSIKEGIQLTQVKGRVEAVRVSDDFSVFIDYAHNAASMQNVLSTLKKYNPHRLITLFGAGGNRPKIRRYEMGEVSGKLSDLSVITDDNPRFEEPSQIIEDIKTGINKTIGKYIVVPGRQNAIKYCLENAQKGDIIVLAGKGHEDYQEIKGVKYPFDERKVINDILSQKI